MTENEESEALEPATGRELLKLALHVSERTLDTDIWLAEHHYGEIERSIRLGIATLGALLVVVGVFATLHFVPTSVQVGILGFGILLNLVAILVWVLTKSGIWNAADVAIGPDLRTLSNACKDPKWQTEDLQASLIARYADNGVKNERLVKALAIGHRAGVLLWMAAVILYLVGFVIVMNTAITG